MTITTSELLEQIAARLQQASLYYGHGTDNATDEAFWLISHGLQHNVQQPLPDRSVSAAEVLTIDALVEQRIAERKPTAYLTGTAWFAGYEFLVTENVLVPRSPLAELIMGQFSPWLPVQQVKSILDIGTGSGCIGIAAALQLPEARLTGLDISLQALDIARKNAERYELLERSQWLQSDLFAAVDGERFDLIVSNPPYVPLKRREELPAEYQAEPKLGLYSGNDGLDHAAGILVKAADQLNKNGYLILEIGESAETLAEQLPEVPFIWPEFEYGGEGVLIASQSLLSQHERDIQAWYASRTPLSEPTFSKPI